METVKLAKTEEAKKESDSKAEQLQKTFQLLQQGETKANEREKETKMYLDMQVSHPPHCILYVISIISLRTLSQP